jgi:diguanylate cyclase (GGDEF)-like protein
VEVNCLCLVVSFLIFLNIRQHLNQCLLDQKLFALLVLVNALILVMDALMWAMDGRTGRVLHMTYQLVTLLYYCLNPVICALWYFYADYHINRNSVHLKKRVALMILPACITLVLSVFSLFRNVLFFIDGNNVYHRGQLFYVMAGSCFLLLAYTMCFIISNRKKYPIKEFAALLSFSIPPILAGIIQSFCYGLSLIWAATTISLLIVFISFQNNQLNTDYLTGLYNRRQLDAYLKSKHQDDKSKEIAGFMIDLNFFKNINDSYGHACGDQALKYIAGILKKTFGKNDFIARFGGDEFVVVMELNEETELERAAARLNENVAKFNAQKMVPYEISLSIGYDSFKPAETTSVDFLKQIDELMYANKQK